MATNKFFERNKRKSILSLILLLFKDKRNLALLAVIMLAMMLVIVAIPPSMVAGIPGAKYVMALFGSDGSFMPKRLSELMREQSKSGYVYKPSDKSSLFAQYYGNGKDFYGSSSIMIAGADEIFKNPAEAEKEAGKKGKKDKGSDPNVPEELDAEPSPVELGDLMEAKPVMDNTEVGGIGLGELSDMKYVASPASSNMVVRMAINNANARIPTIGGKGGKLNTMGRISSFAWRNVDFARRRTEFGISKVGSKRAIRQLSETFTTTAIAFKTNDSETSQVLIGSTYDGSGTTADWLDTTYNAAAGEETSPPDIGDGTASTLTTGTEELQAQADACKDAQNTHGTEMSDAGNIMEKTGQGMGSPPSCCSGRVGSWNSSANTMYTQCVRYNTHSAALSAACQSQASTVDCSQYQSMHISPCSKLHCFFSLFLGILLMVVGFIAMGLGFGIGLALVIAGASLVVGSLVGGALGSIISAIGAAGAIFTGSAAASAATATAVSINSGSGS